MFQHLFVIFKRTKASPSIQPAPAQPSIDEVVATLMSADRQRQEQEAHKRDREAAYRRAAIRAGKSTLD